MILALGLTAAVFLDVSIWIAPVGRLLFTAVPQLREAKKEFQQLKEDQKNKELIQKNWEQAQVELADQEKHFVLPSEIPVLLENLSKLAQDSGVKIVSLKPLEEANPVPRAGRGSYGRISVQISAIAGTHALGKFLSKLEGAATFVRVTDLRIVSNPADLKQHTVNLQIEAFQKGV